MEVSDSGTPSRLRSESVSYNRGGEGEGGSRSRSESVSFNRGRSESVSYNRGRSESVSSIMGRSDSEEEMMIARMASSALAEVASFRMDVCLCSPSLPLSHYALLSLLLSTLLLASQFTSTTPSIKLNPRAIPLKSLNTQPPTSLRISFNWLSITLSSETGLQSAANHANADNQQPYCNGRSYF
jgi:hypothetical protein